MVNDAIQNGSKKLYEMHNLNLGDLKVNNENMRPNLNPMNYQISSQNTIFSDVEDTKRSFKSQKQMPFSKNSL